MCIRFAYVDGLNNEKPNKSTYIEYMITSVYALLVWCLLLFSATAMSLQKMSCSLAMLFWYKYFSSLVMPRTRSDLGSKNLIISQNKKNILFSEKHEKLVINCTFDTHVPLFLGQISYVTPPFVKLVIFLKKSFIFSNGFAVRDINNDRGSNDDPFVLWTSIVYSFWKQ